jgi:hypothetical protein
MVYKYDIGIDRQVKIAIIRHIGKFGNVGNAGDTCCLHASKGCKEFAASANSGRFILTLSTI